jgi:hypothetical protein
LSNKSFIKTFFFQKESGMRFEREESTQYTTKSVCACTHHSSLVWLAANLGHGSLGPIFARLVSRTGSGVWLTKASHTPGA